MFKGIKKRFNSSRSGRGRKGERSPPPGDPTVDPPDRKSTSPRQVHPADLVVSAAPYARRSLERGVGGCRSPCKSPSSPPTPIVTPAYPTAPNLCVTAGKIEFITPPDSTLSSSASRCSTLKLSPSQKSEEVDDPPPPPPPPPLSPTTTNPKGQTASPPGSLSHHPSPSSADSRHLCHKEDALESESQVEELRRENEEVKLRLSTLQQEFTTLEEQVQSLVAERRKVEEQQKAEQEAQEQAYVTKLQQYQATIAALTQCSTTPVEDPPVQHAKMLAERCRTLEEANRRLQKEARAQQQQYEVCLDRVATQVVQALLSQKSHQEQCVKLAHQVKDLRRQNAALSTLMGPTGLPQTLPCLHRHRCPAVPQQNTSLSLPASLRKNRQQSEVWPSGGWVASWHVGESSRSHLGEPHSSQNHLHSSHNLLTEPSLPATQPHSGYKTSASNNGRLPDECYPLKDDSSCITTTITTTNTTTTTCWYDIITSLSSPQSAVTMSPQGKELKLRSEAASVWSPPDQIIPGTGRTSSSSCSSSDSPVQLQFSQNVNRFPQLTESSCVPNSSEQTNNAGKCESSAIRCNMSSDNFSPLSPTSPITSVSHSPEQKKSQVFQESLDNTAFDKSTTTVIDMDGVIDDPSKKIDKELTVDSVSKDDLEEHLKKGTLEEFLNVKREIIMSIKEGNSKDCAVDFTVLSCQEGNKELLDKVNIKSGSEVVVCDGTPGEEGGEGTTKDEGYSTMSSDVQADVKDSITTCSVTTVQEEPTMSSSQQESSSREMPITTTDISAGASAVDNTNTLVDKTSVKERKPSLKGNLEYCDGLRVIYDEEDNNSDVFFIPIQEPENQNLYRHSYHVPSSKKPEKLSRCFSDSYLYKERRNAHNPKLVPSLERPVSVKYLAERSPSTEEVLEEACKTRSLKRASAQASLKRGMLRAREEHPTSGSSEELWPTPDEHRKYLSPTYSHAELEDWSLDLSSEYLSGAGGEGEGSESVGTNGAHHGSLPSIQEATPELEEDNNEFLWNGATYFKTELDLNWSGKKELTESWQLGNSKENHVVTSPRSGCSDQPAVWSSSEQLSCCSEGVSKCSSDFENFCEQICNLPELKRVSICSSEAGGQEVSKTTSHETSSVEEHDELADELCIDTVFTRDFYRLVKFESNKSLAESSRSLTSDGKLTIEKLKDLESGGGNQKEALASVLGFIAEQQKYCKEREAQDENDQSKGSPLTSVFFRGTFPKISSRENFTEQFNHHADEFSMKTLPSLLLKNGNTECVITKNCPPPVPAKPKPVSYVQKDPDCSTHCSSFVPAGHSHPTSTTCCQDILPHVTLPIMPATSHLTPSVPSRSSSLAPTQGIPTPHLLVPQVACQNNSNLLVADYAVANSVYSIQSDVPYSQVVPELSCNNMPCQLTVVAPPVPNRSSSMAFTNDSQAPAIPEHRVCLNDSPPVPKRITSRALPRPPEINPNLRVIHHANGTSKSLGSSQDGKRPRSFIRDALGISGSRRPQSEYSELPTLSENPAGMLEELQRMAKVEEEEKTRGKPSAAGRHEATSPGDTAGLGTGWVRVQPHIDLQDPQARANLLDGMMESSEGCSSETEEDEGAGNQYSQLRSMHRSRRKRKASRRSGGGRVVIGRGICRPSVIGRKDLFVRFGEHEKAALQEFEFLCEMSTSCSDLGSQDFGAAGGGLSKATVTSSVILPSTPSYVTVKQEALPRKPKRNPSMQKKNDRSCYNVGSECVSDRGGVDTSSICSVKTAVRQLNKINQISGIKQPAIKPTNPARSASCTNRTKASLKSSSPSSTKNSRACNPFKSDVNTFGIHEKVIKELNSPVCRTPSPQLSSCDNKSNSGPQVSNEKSQSSNAKSESPTRIPRIQTPLTSSKKSRAESPKSPKDSGCDASKRSKIYEGALPPKGYSSRVLKPSPRVRSSLQQRQQPLNPHQQQQQQPSKSGIRSPRLARIKKAADPLDSFSGKSLCDSGSSEGSERCGGRLSLSDSCAENFSPIDSGDEVFYKEC